MRYRLLFIIVILVFIAGCCLKPNVPCVPVL